MRRCVSQHLGHLPSKFRAALCFLALALALCPVAVAQTASIAVGSAAGTTGTAVVLPVTLNPGAASVSTLQFDLVFSSAFAYTGTSTGSAASTAGKSAVANTISGGVRVLVFGLNQNAIGTGVVAEIRLTITSGAPIGTSPVTLAGMVASDPLAKVIAVSGTSGSITRLTAVDTTPPVISQVSSSDIALNSAVISWTTNESADSLVQYGTTASYGSSSPVNTGLSTAHSQKLTGLAANTLYHYRVKSTDAAGNASISGDYTFTTAAASGNFILTLPRFTDGPVADGQQSLQDVNENLIGMALTNLGNVPASLTFTSMDSSGSLTTGPGILNPRTSVLYPRSQIGVLDSGVFGDAFSYSGTKGWIKLETASPDIRGFFLAFDARLSLMDGANFGTTPLTDFAFTEIEPSGWTRINVANGNPDPAIVTFNLLKGDGTIRSTQSKVISGSGALVADLYRDLFPGLEPDATDYVRAFSSRGVSPFELMRKGTGDISSLTGQDTTAGGVTLYSPQYVVGGPWRTNLSVVNLESRAGAVTLRFIGENGIQIGSTKTTSIPAFGKLQVNNLDYFAPLTPGTVTAGYVEVVSDGIRLTGSTVFGDIADETFSSALPLISDLQSSLLFSHIASNDLYFTGIAILNPKAENAGVTIEIYSADGRMLDSRQEWIPGRQRSSRLLTEYFPSLVGKDQSSGYIRVLSNAPIAAFALFGTNDLSVLSAIPPQVP